MATLCSEVTASLNSKDSENEFHAILRRCRGRPRLSDTDRARRRLESRKKYDVRRVYLGESHKLWSDLRQKTCLSDAGLAEYLILLNSAYGDRYQQKYSVKNFPELCRNQKKGKKVAATSLHSIVSWYQEHCQMCCHEPELRSVEPMLGLSTTVLWQCDAEHSFTQHISWPVGGSSESDEDDTNRQPEPERTSFQTAATAVSNQKLLADELESATAEVAKVSQRMSSTAFSQLPESHTEAVTSSPSLGEQVMWESEQERELSVASCENEVRDNLPFVEEACDLKPEMLGGHASRTDSYECVVVTAALKESLHRPDGASHLTGDIEENEAQSVSGAGTDTPTAATPEQTDLYETQAMQSMVRGCELPDQHATLQGSQLIIITGSSYEAMTSEGIQLNVGGGDVEGVTCTVIEGVAYNQMCQSDVPTFQNSISHTDTMTDLSEKQLLEPSEESRSQKNVQCSLSRSKRSRQGPVIEADGMLKMFHCPYEGCSQVYVALSSYQNHVNLVHRKGRTKMCPHPGCGKKFYLSNHLHRHMIIHSGVRDFICETCGKSFKRKNHLEVHRRTHTGETPLQCEICGYQCRQRASLNWHMKKHTSDAQFNYTCEHCGKRFEKLDSVKFHKLKSHPDRQAP
ncbi:zinc finger protein 653 isoform 2-T2 [Clarias gariepinus]|uniref:zinc finger protein 653 n=1 Tax=Clarias gariepinus TaxID=13013 RepID=UPI00234DE33C|nr:zinc finger protein 653 [Clarias gariepinus]